jgi:2-keto-4-pentenoate hydratase/2-oxohepta-3-ene-1,7-dioic acid hydratase in catechol pathway
VVDLPDLVGHPAFPTSMEALVASSGGTVLDAARAALERDEAAAFVVDGARLLSPILPTSLRSRDEVEGLRPVAGPGDVVPWPDGAGWLEFEPRIAAVLGRGVRGAASSRDVEDVVFGYTLVSDFAVRRESGDPTPQPGGLPVAIGPCILTPDEIDPQMVFVTVRVDGDQWAKGNLNGTAHHLLEEVAAASRLEALGAGEAFAACPLTFAELDHRVWPGAEIELDAEGIGVLRNRIDRQG